MIERVQDTSKVEHLFADWDETVLLSCLQGVMGEIYAPAGDTPACAMAALGDFCFLAGEPNEELAAFRPAICQPDFVIIVPKDDSWCEAIEKAHGSKANRTVRYAIKKEPGIFDREHLSKAVKTLPNGYEICKIGEMLYNKCLEEEWSRDFVQNFASFDLFSRFGLGILVLKDGEIVAGTSSYSGYIGGIEIEVVTKEAYRQKGLAYACSAALILECMDKNLYPSWDAKTKISVALAEKLGYHFNHEYTAYEIVG